MSTDSRIKRIPVGKGFREEVSDYTTSDVTGRTIVPSATGPDKGAQLGRDHTVASASVLTLPDGSKKVITPPGYTEPNVSSAVDVERVPDLESEATTTPEGPVPATPGTQDGLQGGGTDLQTLLPPENVVARSTGFPAVRPPVEPETPSPAVSVTLRSPQGAQQVIRWRARYHEVLVSESAIILVWDTRFKHADSPLLPFDAGGDPVGLHMLVQRRGGTGVSVLPENFDVAAFDISFTHGHHEYYVFVRDTAKQEVQPAGGLRDF